MAKKKNKPATAKQIAEIDKGIKELEIGENLEDFVKKISSEEYREKEEECV